MNIYQDLIVLKSLPDYIMLDKKIPLQIRQTLLNKKSPKD
jgi:hypothetical protein